MSGRAASADHGSSGGPSARNKVIAANLEPGGAEPAGRRRGSPPDQERRDAIREAITKHGDKRRENLSDIFADLDKKEVPLGNFQNIKVNLGDDQFSRVSIWADLDLAEGAQRTRIIDAIRKYTDGRS
jgi:hypothetical protein